MAFVTVEDLYGTCEIIIFDSCYQQASSLLVVDEVILVDGRLSVREDDDVKIVAREIKPLTEKKGKALVINITNLDETKKDRLRGILKFFNGDKNNMPVQIINGEEKIMAGGVYLTPEILKEFQEIAGENLVLEEI